jgi:outer membrane protein OmpA-like peptidoglycan-associated protein
MNSKLIYLIIILIFSSCTGTRIFWAPPSNPPERNEKNKDKSIIDIYEPYYRDNGGERATNIFNRKEVRREHQFMEFLKRIPGPKPTPPGPPDETSEVIAIAIREYNKKLKELESKLASFDIYGKGNEEEYENLLIELNNLICKHKEGIELLEKKVRKLYGDVSFKSGSSDISGKGKESIKDLIKNIETEVERWRKYTNQCNENIFQNDLFVVVINIDGYADERGREESNLILSQKRAGSVEKLLISELTDLTVTKKTRIVFNRIYSRGFGELLPPGVEKSKMDDPNRRICIISYIVGPSRYLKEK